VSKVLPALLASKGWTQENLADKTGIGRGTINGYCTGRLPLGRTNGQRIAAALGVNAGLLLGEDALAETDSLEARVAHLEAQLDELRQQLRELGGS
jgi:transcriptional regulator with XRE-family HTH domain